MAGMKHNGVNQMKTDNFTFLSDSQKSHLSQMKSESGIQCLVGMWLNHSYGESDGLYCNATWDNMYCWPPTPAGNIIRRACSVALNGTHVYASMLEGFAERVCQENGTWSDGVRTNYNACADSFEQVSAKIEEHRNLVVLVQYLLFFGSIISVLFLFSALGIIYSFRCVWCDRVIIQAQLMFALVFRCVILFVLSESYVLKRSTSYRDVDFVCKGVVTLHLYATMCTVSWMFIQGLYLTYKFTVISVGTNNREHFNLFYFIGWVLPAIFIFCYVIVMTFTANPEGCWPGYADMTEIWILLGPMVVALVINAGFLVNIERILYKKVRRSKVGNEGSQFIAAAKATLMLFPILGLNNLLLLYNPGGIYEKYYVTLNTFCGSTQGIFVSIVYCITNKDIHKAIQRCWNRVKTRWEGNLRKERQSHCYRNQRQENRRTDDDIQTNPSCLETAV